MTFFEQALDPILRPLLSLGPFMTILIISLVIAVITTVIYKYATDQERLKKLKADMKRYQKKAMASKDDPQKAMKIQKDMMKLNGEYMRSSMKSMLYTFIPILLFFGWLGANVAFAPLTAGDPFIIQANFQEGVDGSAELMLPSELSTNDTLIKNVSDSTIWNGVQGPPGTYDISIRHSGGEEQFVSLIITDDKFEYVNPEHILESDVFESIIVGNKKLRVFRGVPILGHIPWIKNANWFWSYFLFSLIFSTALRKLLKVA